MKQTAAEQARQIESMRKQIEANQARAQKVRDEAAARVAAAKRNEK
jgi:hypothetical protein